MRYSRKLNDSVVLKLEEVRGLNLAPDARCHFACTGCLGLVSVHTPQGYRMRSDRLCSACFRRCLKWSAVIGDSRATPRKVAGTKFRQSGGWLEVVREWTRINNEARAVADAK